MTDWELGGESWSLAKRSLLVAFRPWGSAVQAGTEKLCLLAGGRTSLQAPNQEMTLTVH